MTTRTRLVTRLAVVAVLALVLGLVGVAGMATSAEATGSPGQSNHCPMDTTQVRFEKAGSHDGFTVVKVSGYVWTWTYDGDLEIASAFAFGGNTLKEVPGVAGTTSGTISAYSLDLRNHGGKIAEISHVDFCLVEPEPETFTVIPQKVWEFGDADVPEDGLAVITITVGEKAYTWTFDSSGVLVDGPDAIELVVGTEYLVTEKVTAPEGFTCQLPAITKAGTDHVVVTVTNVCTEDEVPVTIPPVVITVPPVVATTTTTTVPPEVEGEVVESTTTTVVEVAGEVVLPRTGRDSATMTLAAFAALALGVGLVAAGRRRELHS
jgi:LPXTG-motif cell wall-anchored protein